jgi:hypothetical protein
MRGILGGANERDIQPRSAIPAQSEIARLAIVPDTREHGTATLVDTRDMSLRAVTTGLLDPDIRGVRAIHVVRVIRVIRTARHMPAHPAIRAGRPPLPLAFRHPPASAARPCHQELVIAELS